VDANAGDTALQNSYMGKVKPERNSVLIKAFVPVDFKKRLDKLTAEGIYLTHSDAIRTALRWLLFEKHDSEGEKK